MLCSVCRNGLDGVWDSERTKRIGLLKDFPDLLEKLFPEIEDGNYNEALDEHESHLLEPERYVFGHHTDYNSMLHSKLSGCVVCSEFTDLNDHDDVNPSFAILGYYSTFQILLPRGDASQATMIVYVGEPLEEISHDMIAHDDNNQENDDLNSAISNSTSDLQTWTHIQTWVDRCFKDHKLCLHQDTEIFSPTRLLELRRIGDEKIFRLVNREECNPAERYITLSHCWGPGPPEEKLRLLKSTMNDLRGGLSVNSLPRTFQHAFEIIDRLRVRYLWIDRLCIFQDSAEDWRAEASTMQSVYRHGLLNIAALGALDDQAGCFFDRDPALVAPTVVDLSPKDGSISMFYRFEAEQRAWVKDFEGQPLLSRAWVLQERILSTRNLYFGKNQVFWECFETNCCETVPDTCLDDRSYYSSYSGINSTCAWKPLIHPQKKQSTAQPTYWDVVLLAYSQCKLTFPCDKLVAISGLAKRMGDMMRANYGNGHDIYLAGLWKHTMPGSLLWAPKTICDRFSPYRAPSWSWASLDGDLHFKFIPGQARLRVELLGAEIIPHGKDVTGEIISGTLTLRGHICKARRSKKVRDIRDDDREIYSIGSLHHPESDASVDFHHPTSDTPIDLNIRTRYLQFDTMDDNHETVVLLFFTCEPHKAKVLAYVQVQGLALILDDQTQSYRRVGIVWFKEPSDLDGDSGGELFCQFPKKTINII